MGRLEQERQSLLPISSNSSNSTTNSNTLSSSEENPNSDNEDTVEFQQRTKYFRTKVAGAIRRQSSTSIGSNASSALFLNSRRKFPLSRGLGKRFIRLLLCAFLIPMLLFLILYSSMFSGASSRHCKIKLHFMC